MKKGITNEIAIYIGFDQVIAEEVVKNISLGIEEEGVPFELHGGFCGESARTIAQSMSMQSKLDIGIGVDGAGKVAIHHSQFPEGYFLFETSVLPLGHWIRSIGANSARLAKGIPFKALIE